jgi:hypothetical protein
VQVALPQEQIPLSQLVTPLVPASQSAAASHWHTAFTQMNPGVHA